MERMTAEEMSRVFHTNAANSVYADTVSTLTQMLKDYAQAEIAEIRHAIQATFDEMGGGGCLDGKCEPEPDEPPCPWRHVVAALAPKAGKDTL